MNRLLHDLLAASVEKYPDNHAVIYGHDLLRYEQLEVRSNQLAWLLIENGIQPGDRVALYLEKSIASLIAIYGTLKCGAAYVPLDTYAPRARVRRILGNCTPKALLTDHASFSTAHAAIPDDHALEIVVEMDAPAIPSHRHENVNYYGAEAVMAKTASPPNIPIRESDLAYILYTSGSTGAPKGVMLSHLNGRAFVDWAVRRFDIGPTDRLSNHAPLHFDLSVFDVFAAASRGAVVCLLPPQTAIFPGEVTRFIEEARITIWYSVPSALTMMTLHGDLDRRRCADLRTVLFAGEVFPTKHLRRAMELLPHARFYNLYGPTETNVCTCYEVDKRPASDQESVPIGSAIDGVEILVVDDDRKPVGTGEMGELVVHGPTVMQGYWQDAERTADVLVPHPTRSDSGDLAYTTGDLVVQEPDAVYRFIGRRDSQVKTRGYRVELGEIEQVLQTHPDVIECAVVAIPDEILTNRLKAYVTTRGDVTEKELIQICADNMPLYMIPEEFESRHEFPRTSTAKIDKRALAAEAKHEQHH